MAINGDFLTLDGVWDILDYGQQEIYNLMNTTSQLQFRKKTLAETLNKLDHLIGLFKVAEKGALTQLHAQNLEELEQRFKDFYAQSGYSQFINIDLAKIIKAEFETATGAGRSELREKYIVILNNLVVEACNTIGQNPAFIQGSEKAVLTEVSRLLKKYGFDSGNVATGQGKGGLTVSSKIIHWDQQGNLSFFPELATSIVSARLNTMMTKAADKAALATNRHYSKEEKDQLKRLTSMSTKNSIQQLTASTNIGFQIGKITEGATETQAKTWDKNTLISKNNNIRYAIVLQLPPAYRKTANKIIKAMLDKNEYMFFVGVSAEQLRGVLGEIASMHAVAHFLGLTEPDDEIIEWVATERKKGKQLSVDIVLKKFTNIKFDHQDIEGDFGIQVKNVEDNRIDFVDTSMETILDKLGIKSQYIEDIVFSKDFNIEYEYNLVTSKYVPMFSWAARLYGWQSFLIVENKIDQAVEDLRIFLQQYSAEFMYMGFGDGFVNSLATLSNQLNKLSGNIIYIIRDVPYFASEMLIKIRKALQYSMDETISNPLRINTYISKLESDQKQDVNIINFKNSGNDVEELRRHNVKVKSSVLFPKKE